MSSIYIKAARVLHRHSKLYGAEDPHDSIPFLVFSRGLFDCIAPRIEHILTRERGHTSRVVSIASNACTFHLTREVRFVINYENDIQTTLAALRKLTQVASLTLARSDSGKVNMAPVFSEVMRFASTLTALHYSNIFSDLAEKAQFSKVITELHNLTELTVPSLTPELCEAIAAGPGARLRQLTLSCVDCELADMDVVVAGCPNIWALRLDTCRCDALLSASKLQYLQSLQAWVLLRFLPTVETDMRTAFGDMQRLTKLDLYFSATDFSHAMAAIIAATVGPQLVEFTLSSRTFSSDAFSTLCCASSFPQLEVMSLNCYGGSVIEHDVTVSLSPSLLRVKLSDFELAPRTLTSLLSNKPMLKECHFRELAFSRRRGRNNGINNNDHDEATPAPTSATEDDWFGKLVKSPVQKLHVDGNFLLASMDTRIALLAPTLVDVRIDVDDWPAVSRDRFLGALFSRCVMLEQCLLINGSALDVKMSAVDAKVAFAGLRNNERLRCLYMDCCIRSLSALVRELLAMKSTELRYLQFPKADLSFEQCMALAERFVHLEWLEAELEGCVREVLQKRFPRVHWQE